MGFTFPTAFFGPQGPPPLYRPTTSAFSTTGSTGTPSHSNDAQAYDTSTATAGTLAVTAVATATTGTAYAQIGTYSGFTAVTFTGTLKVLVSSTTQDNFGSGVAESKSSCKVEYSLNGGGTWTTLATITAPSTDWSNTLLTQALTAQALGSLQVRCTAQGDNTNNGTTDRCKSDSTLLVYDIRVE